MTSLFVGAGMMNFAFALYEWKYWCEIVSGRLRAKVQTFWILQSSVIITNLCLLALSFGIKLQFRSTCLLKRTLINQIWKMKFKTFHLKFSMKNWWGLFKKCMGQNEGQKFQYELIWMLIELSRGWDRYQSFEVFSK